MKRFFALFAFVCAISGCATVINPKTLAAPSKKTSMTLAVPYSYVGQWGGHCKAKIEYSLAPGTYVAEYQDANGVFYRGPANAITSRLLGVSCSDGHIGQGLQLNGGIYIPVNPTKDAKVYYYQASHALYNPFLTGVMSPPPSGAIVDAIVAYGYGKIQFLPLQPADGLLRKSVILNGVEPSH